MKPTDFATRLTAFLMQYLPSQRNVSPNTIKGYRDVFSVLLRFCRDHRDLPPERLHLEHLDASLIEAFLIHLETERNCGARTRNHRLAALHSFFRYLQVEEPDRILQCQRILAIPSKRFVKPEIDYLRAADLEILLAQPDLSRREGRRDAVLLSVLYDTAARSHELVGLSPRDLRLEPPAFVRIAGKGRKIRAVPLMDATVTLLRQYLEENHLQNPEASDEPLFQNRRGGRLSRSGLRYILLKYVRKTRAIRAGLPRRVSPHTLRHTKAMHMVEADVPLIAIRDILGHSDFKTTEIYGKANLEMKRQALEKVSGDSPRVSIPSWQRDQSLLDWLRSL
jgi:site-specific recombinase XerD